MRSWNISGVEHLTLSSMKSWEFLNARDSNFCVGSVMMYTLMILLTAWRSGYTHNLSDLTRTRRKKRTGMSMIRFSKVRNEEMCIDIENHRLATGIGITATVWIFCLYHGVYCQLLMEKSIEH